MRRPTAFVLGTLVGSALLVGAKLGSQPAGTQTITGPPGDEVPVAGDGGVGSPTATPGPTGAPRPDMTAGPTKAPTSPTREEASQPAPEPDGPPRWSSGTYAGIAVTHKYGTLRVTITINGSEITAISESYQTSLQLSKKINAEALPQLRKSALSAQSADIENVSGATYTSDAYRASLRSALDNAAR